MRCCSLSETLVSSSDFLNAVFILVDDWSLGLSIERGSESISFSQVEQRLVAFLVQLNLLQLKLQLDVFKLGLELLVLRVPSLGLKPVDTVDGCGNSNELQRE